MAITKRPIKRFTPGIRPKKLTKGKEPKLDLLGKLRKAEADLKSIRSTDPNAKFALARMRSQQLFVDTNDTHYWIAVCFSSRAQKEEFLKKSGLELDDEDIYFSGPALAKKMGITLANDDRAFHTLSVNRRWGKFAMPAKGRIPPKRS